MGSGTDFGVPHVPGGDGTMIMKWTSSGVVVWCLLEVPFLEGGVIVSRGRVEGC